MSERVLVTGARGCIGSWVVRLLLDEGAHVIALDHAGSDHRLRLLLTPAELAAVRHVDADVSQLAAVEAVVTGGVDRVIHLAGLQVPFCRADPSLGARVNVVGTVNVFEAVKRAGGIAGPVAYASSVAAYDDGPDAGSADPSGHPSTHYGVYKFANEGTARVYGADDGIASVGIRPYVVYGVGRDQGMTSSPTFAMLAAAVGRPWTISYSGVSHLQLASDTAAAFIAAARSPYAGAGVFNLGGAVVDMTAVVAAIEAAVPAAAGTIGIDGPALPFPGEVVAEAFAREVAAVPSASLQDGVAATVERFRSLAASGALDLARLLG